MATNSDPRETRGWEIVKLLNEGLKAENTMDSLSARKLLAEYFKLGCYKPSRLHSAILSCAVKMAMQFPEFHFVPFLSMWGMENLRPEDSESRTDESGKRFPSVAERMTKAYAYSLMFHPDEHLDAEEEQTLRPLLVKKGYKLMDNKEGGIMIYSALATGMIQSEVRNRKMYFVSLLLSDGIEMLTEVHTITQYNKMRYDDIPNKCFNVIVRTSENGNLRVEAAYLNNTCSELFTQCVGYVEHIDVGHKHIHVYDSESRHFVQSYAKETPLKEGAYVRFVPVIPKESKFKSAVITSVVENGPEAFGLRDAMVMYVNVEQGYCAWELIPDAEGKVQPIIETGTTEMHEPATKGYINKSVCDRLGREMPKKGDKLRIVTFLKRGKDKKKRPVVVYWMS